MHFLLCVQQQPEKFTYVASCEIILLPWYSLFAPDPGLTLFLEAIGSPGESKPSDILVKGPKGRCCHSVKNSILC